MASRATAERAAPRLGVFASIVLHLGLVAALFISFSHKLDIATDSTPLVPVDLVTVADETNIKPPEFSPPVITPDNTPPPEPAMVEPEPQPDIAPPDIDIAKPEPEAKPKPKPEQKFNIADIEKLLSKRKTADTKARTRPVQGAGAQTAMTADLATMLKSQIYRCWSPPTGAPHPERLIVSYELFLTRDGSVAQPPQLTSESATAAAGDPYMAAAAGAARRAIYACAPYRLPPDRYAQWRDVIFTFDPRTLNE